MRNRPSLENFVFSLHVYMSNTQRTGQFKMSVNVNVRRVIRESLLWPLWHKSWQQMLSWSGRLQGRRMHSTVLRAPSHYRQGTWQKPSTQVNSFWPVSTLAAFWPGSVVIVEHNGKVAQKHLPALLHEGQSHQECRMDLPVCITAIGTLVVRTKIILKDRPVLLKITTVPF